MNTESFAPILRPLALLGAGSARGATAFAVAVAVLLPLTLGFAPHSFFRLTIPLELVNLLRLNAAAVLFGCVAGLCYCRRLSARRAAHLEVEQITARCERSELELRKAANEVEALHTRIAAAGLREPVTGLPNRRACLDAIDRTVERLRHATGRQVAVFAVGFEKLQRVADVFGHPVVDKLLLEAARRVEIVLQPQDSLFRIGDTRLAIIVTDVGDETAALALANSLAESLRESCTVEGGRFHLDPSIGISCVGEGYECADQILDHATLAMNQATESEHHGVCVFQKRSADEVVQRLQLESELRRAIELREFVLWYQPVFDIHSNAVAGFEALLRWQHPRHGIVEPARFLSTAHEMGLMGDITQWVLREAASQAAAWGSAGTDRPFISANLTAESFEDPDLVGRIAALQMEFVLPPGKLKLEIVESTVVANVTRTAKLIATLKELGVPVWLDDFGTGYSSLSYLRALAFQGVKLDRSFVARMTVDSRDFGLVKSIIDLLHYLEMSCVAEGVETHEQRELLALVGCDLCQGYFFARPMPAAAAGQLLVPVGVAPGRRASL